MPSGYHIGLATILDDLQKYVMLSYAGVTHTRKLKQHQVHISY